MALPVMAVFWVIVYILAMFQFTQTLRTALDIVDPLIPWVDLSGDDDDGGLPGGSGFAIAAAVIVVILLFATRRKGGD